jgi:hypothetical protein
VHTATVLFHVYSGFGAWVGVSFTMTSFALITTHCLGAALSPWSAAAAAVARALRFPMLAFNGVTFCVWWGVLFPGGTFLLRGRARAGFVKMQREWGMVNIHGLNLALAVVQGLLVLPHGAERAEPFGFFDLWIAVACAVAYLFFYIAYLEPSGAHLYIILSPRTPLALPVYALLLASIFSLWLAFSRAVDEGWLEDLYVR